MIFFFFSGEMSTTLLPTVIKSRATCEKLSYDRVKILCLLVMIAPRLVCREPSYSSPVLMADDPKKDQHVIS